MHQMLHNKILKIYKNRTESGVDTGAGAGAGASSVLN